MASQTIQLLLLVKFKEETKNLIHRNIEINKIIINNYDHFFLMV